MANGARCTSCLVILAITVWLAGCAGVDVIPDSTVASGGGPAEGTADVVGRVVSVPDAEPVAGATVAIDSSVTATTGSDGEFLIQNISVGQHWLDVYGAGYTMLGGAMQIEVEAESSDLGQIVVCPGARLSPPSVPEF
ncbi:MAG: carboxypeptidase regulatory-like domain-containing protein [Armatimonadota bacterium]|nr:carboxypeptidase regulatory-like domain-containing protein [Armatimonadota bacterium]